MKHLKILSIFLLLSFFPACTADIDGLSERVDDLEARVEALEELCSQMNTNISSLQTIVGALQDNDYISSIAPIVEGEDTVGYVINFTQSGSVTIYHGEDGINGQNGQDGHTPVIGVALDSDGLYYWTVDGEWLLDEAGGKVQALGRDGITPQLKIETDGYWYISYDGGTTWTQLGKATGEDGDSMFSGVTQDDDNVYLTLADGTVITLPKVRKLDLQFSETDGIACAAGQTVRVAYTLTGGNSQTRIASIGEGGWTSNVEKTDDATGFIAVTAPVPITPGKVLVMADNNQGQTVMKTLTFEEGVLTVVADTYFAEGAAGEVSVHINTNITDYTVHIPEDAQSWLSVVPLTRSEMRTDTLRLALAEYPEGTIRRASVEICCAGQLLQAFTVEQTAVKQEVIEFADPLVKQILVESTDPLIDTDHDGEISYSEAERALTIPTFQGTMIKSFDELQHFTSIARVPESAFEECKVLTSVQLPENLLEIGWRAFVDCSSLTELELPDGLMTIWASAFARCASLSKLVMPESVTAIYGEVFEGCLSLTEVVIPEKVTELPNNAFSGCSNLSSVRLPTGLEYIGMSAFGACSKLAELSIPGSVTFIGSYAFQGCAELKELNLPEGLTNIAEGTFAQCTSLDNVVLPDGVVSIGESAFRDCNSLKNIFIPANMRYLGAYAFSWCGALNQVTFASVDPPIIGQGIFGYCSDMLQLLIPAGTMDAYSSATGWSEYVQYLVESTE